jgi:3-methylfumaryl-CoA hydratase
VSDWSGWVGRTSTTTARLDPAQANRLAVTLDHEPDFTAGDALPPAWHWLYFHDLVATSKLGGDGHPKLGLIMPPSPLERRMWAAGRIEFVSPMLLGATATRATTIRSITPKKGGSGQLLFVTVEHDIRVDGRPTINEEQTIVYRELSAPPSGREPLAAPQDQDFSDQWQLDSPALFRYSALTFNSHRIHYDVDYARDIEGYPGLVVHGPLLVTLLLDSAVRRNLDPASIDYRAVSPVFLPEAFSVNGRYDDGQVALWATTSSGYLAMDAVSVGRQGHIR